MAFMIRLNPVTPQRWSFILAGQSNMSGRGNLGELPSFPYHYKVKNYANNGTWKDAVEPIDSSSGQVDSVSEDDNAAASPGLAFGNALASLLPYHEIGLIPCATGGTTIANWQKSGTSRSTLYGSMLARAQEASAAGPIKGLLFYQGESDANNSTAASNWGTSFLAMVNDLRTDLELPDLKVIVTKLHADPESLGDYWSTIQAEQEALDGELSGDVAVVDASDLDTKPGDPVHLRTSSLVTLGERYAATMYELLGG